MRSRLINQSDLKNLTSNSTQSWFPVVFRIIVNYKLINCPGVTWVTQGLWVYWVIWSIWFILVDQVDRGIWVTFDSFGSIVVLGSLG